MALWVGIGVVAYTFVADTWVTRLHSNGWHQSSTGFVNALSTLFDIFASGAIKRVHVPGGHVRGWAAVYFHFVTFGAYTALAFVFLSTRAWWKAITESRAARSDQIQIPLPKAVGVVISGDHGVAGSLPKLDSSANIERSREKHIPPTPNQTRRAFLGNGIKTFGTLGAAATLGEGMILEPRRLSVTRHTFALPGLPASLAGLRLAQVTDIHHGPWMSLDNVSRVVQTVNALRPDLILLTGDYVHRSDRYIKPAIEVLSSLRAPVGVIGILGNHDWWEGPEETMAEFKRHGIPLIDNHRIFVNAERKLVERSDEGVCFAGVGDYMEDTQDYEASLGGLPDELPRVLLSHNPDVAEDARFRVCGHRVDLMLSGHTHGGQIHIPGYGAPITSSRYGRKYAHGWKQGPVCPVYVCAGIGMSMFPVRLGVAPEVTVIELARK